MYFYQPTQIPNNFQEDVSQISPQKAAAMGKGPEQVPKTVQKPPK